jgi:membrane associated rhomboid family serine protease
MIIPIGDVQKTRHTAWINWLLIAANCVIFVSYFFKGQEVYVSTINTYGMKPDNWQNLKTLFTSMFLHADPLHLLGNMLFLYIAGDNVEDRLGHVGYLFFYLLAGLAGSAAHIVFTTQFGSGGSVPTIGASGAISGVMGAYLIFFPRVQIKFMIWLIIFVRFFTLPSWGVIGFWVASQVMMARSHWDGTVKKDAATVAVFAHLGGFAFGMVVALFVRMSGKEPKRSRDQPVTAWSRWSKSSFIP